MISDNYFQSVIPLFRYYKRLGEQAMAQLSEEDLNRVADPESNSIAVIVKHLSGNMLSRWTDFLNQDGEKTWRDREGEFVDTLETAGAVREAWEKGWSCLFDALGPLGGEDLDRIVYIRNEGHTVMEAVNRQLAHYAYHVGQIVYLAKQLRGTAFLSLSIPKGGSQLFNQEKFDQEKNRKHFLSQEGVIDQSSSV